MNLQAPAGPAHPTQKPVALDIVDCDIHPKARSLEAIKPYMTEHWWEVLQTYGQREKHGFAKSFPYPKAAPQAARRDSWPPDGGLPASDLDFLKEQLLDLYGVRYGIMNPLAPTGQGAQNPGLSAAMAHASNEWQVAEWTSREPRLKASIVVPYEDAEASAAEIRKRAGRREFAQVLLMSRTSEPLGRKRYWPIYAAAVEAGLPVGIHVFGYSGWAITNSGWASFYIEEMTEHSTSAQALVGSLIVEGVFEAFPDLKVVLIEAGFGWLPALGWRLDNHWKKLKREVPHLRRAPSEYLREHFWVSTQPMEESERQEHIFDTMHWIGMDRILFATDYPHWDFDDPRYVLPPGLTSEERRAIFSENAKALYGLD